MKIHRLSASLAFGILWALGVFLMALVVKYFSLWQEFVDFISIGYIGYASTWTGAFIGLVWAFADAFIGVYILVSLYNYFVKKFSR